MPTARDGSASRTPSTRCEASGQRFELLSHRHNWGEQRVHFRDGAGRLRPLPEERAAEIAARTLALPDAQSVEDRTARLTSAGEC